MPFQKSVQAYPARGVAGQRAGNNPMAFLFPTPTAGTGGVTVGNFAWPGSTAGTVVAGGTGVPAGLVLRELVEQLPTGLEATMSIAAGQSCAVVVRGDVFVTSTTAAVVGQVAFANLTTGAVSTAAAGATVAGAVETTWKVREAAAVGDVLMISNW